MILDKLMEKKDLVVYCNLRIERLEYQLYLIAKQLECEEVSNSDKKSLMRGKKQIKGRIKELVRLRGIVQSSSVKEEGKKMWRAMNYD